MNGRVGVACKEMPKAHTRAGVLTPLRRLFLVVVGAGFLLTAGAGLLAPGRLTAMVGLSLEGVSAYSEIRSNYGGMHAALGLFILWTALTPTAFTVRAALLVIALFTGGYAFGRVLSLMVDGWPHALIIALTGAEAIVSWLAWRMSAHDPQA